MGFELIDNLFQTVWLSASALAAGILAFRRRNRKILILALGYACFSMGTLYWLLNLAIINRPPRVFYVSEISWLAAYLFYLSLQIARTEGIHIRFSAIPAACAAVIAAAGTLFGVLGPSRFMSALFGIVAGAIAYFSVFRLMRRETRRAVDGVMLACAVLQIAVYRISGTLVNDYTRFNLYFAVDMLMTVLFSAMLPMICREEAGK